MAEQDVTVELYHSGAWQDVTSGVYTRDDITITHGRADEQSQPPPSTATLTFDNRGGTYNPRNPASPLYGLVGRNTPLRITVDGSVRFAGEVASWTPRIDVDDGDAWTVVEAAGITRRLGQGATPVTSPLRRTLTSEAALAELVAYWPLEDRPGAAQAASGLPGGQAMTLTGGGWTFSSDDSTFGGSAALPVLSGSGQLVGDIGANTGLFVGFCVLKIPSGTPDGTNVATFHGAGTVGVYQVRYGTASGGSLSYVHRDADGAALGSPTVFATGVNGVASWLTFGAEQDGADVDVTYSIVTVVAGSSGVAQTATPTLTSQTRGKITSVALGSDATGPHSGTVFGHLAVFDYDSFSFTNEEIVGYPAETAGRRIERLCAENGVPFASLGDLDDTAAMGPQGVGALLDLLHEAAEADLGILYDDAESGEPVLRYRTREISYNRTPVMTLDAAVGGVGPPLDPVVDDQTTRNDVTVTRTDGSSARATLDTGPMSTLAPPDGVGVYDEAVTVNVATDADLPDQAAWRVHLGTVDEIRWPSVTVDVDAAIANGLGLPADIPSVSPGRRIDLTGLSETITSDDASLLVQGWTEAVESHRRKITFNAVPESPWRVFEIEHDDYGRLPSGASTLTASFAAGTATSMSVTIGTVDGVAQPLWSTTPGDYPVDVVAAGVRLTVTAVTGASSPQTLTVVQAPVNGVTKTIPAGTPVDLALVGVIRL